MPSPADPNPPPPARKPASLKDDASPSPRPLSRPPAPVAPCPACGRALRAGAVICMNCGYNAKTGLAPGTGVGATARSPGVLTCTQCGYSLKGLRDARCPECGTVSRPKSWRDWSKEDGARIRKRTYLVPSIMIGVSAAVIVVALLFTGEIRVLPSIAASLGLSCLGGILAYVFLCAVWIGSDAFLGLTILRLLAIDATFFALAPVVHALIPGGVPLLILTIGAYVLLTARMLDLETIEAFVLAVLKTIITVAVVALIPGAN